MNQAYITEIGQVLQHARQDLHLTLGQASNALHIRAHYLQALETGELDILPGAAYAKGYLLSYASFLHLDKNEILRRFERVEEDIPQRGLFFPQVFSNEKKPPHTIVWGGLLLAVLLYLGWYFYSKPNFSAVSIIEPPPSITEPFKEYRVAGSVLNLSCARAQTKLYPACYREDIKNPSKKRKTKTKSVMEIIK